MTAPPRRLRRVELLEQPDGSWLVSDSDPPPHPLHLARPESLWEAAMLAAMLDTKGRR